MHRPSTFRQLVTALFTTAALLLSPVTPIARAQNTRARVTQAPSSSRELSNARLAVFDDVWRTINERYYDRDFNGADWEALGTASRSLAAGPRTQAELYEVLRRMIGQLRDPHTRVYAPDERTDWHRPRSLSVGVRVREIDGGLIVAAVERGSEAERAGVRAADAVVSIDGEAASTVLARRLAMHQERRQVGRQLDQSVALAASPSARVAAVARLFDGPRDSFAAVTFEDRDARRRTVRLRRVLRERAPSLGVRRVDGFGVVELTAFTPEVAAGFARVLRGRLQNVRGIVLDLRDNGGGEADAMVDVASFFLPAGRDLGRFINRDGRTHLDARTRAAMLSAADAITPFRGPLIILTGPRTASAAEVFAAAMKEQARASIIGETTCGCVLGVRRRHTLPDGGVLEVSEADYRTARGVRLEGSGITPNEAVTPTLQDLSSGYDRALQRAVEMLKAMFKN